MSDQEMREFGPIERDGEGRLSAEHKETGWTIKARDTRGRFDQSLVRSRASPTGR